MSKKHMPLFFSKSKFLISFFLVLTVTVSSMIELIGVSVTNIMIPELVSVFDLSEKYISLVSSAYIISGIISLSISSYFYKYFGFTNLFKIVIVGFTMSSAIVSLSPNFTILLFFRVLQGFFGGIVIAISQSVLYQNFKGRSIKVPSAVYSIGLMLGPALGPTLGGYIVDHYSWRLVYATNVPAGVIILVLASFCFPKEELAFTKRDKFPYVNAIAITSIILLIYLVCERFYLGYSYIGELIVYAILILISFYVLFNINSCPNHILNLKLLKDRNFYNGCLGVFLISFSAFGTILIFPIYFQKFLGYSAFDTGLIFLPSIISMAVGMALGGILPKDKQYELFIVSGSMITLISFLVLSFGTFKGIDEQLFWPLIFRGFGIGLVFVPLSNISLTRISKKQIPDGSVLFNILRQFGGALGVTFAGQLISIPNNSLLFNTETRSFSTISIALLFFVFPVIVLICVFTFPFKRLKIT